LRHYLILNVWLSVLSLLIYILVFFFFLSWNQEASNSRFRREKKHIYSGSSMWKQTYVTYVRVSLLRFEHWLSWVAAQSIYSLRYWLIVSFFLALSCFSGSLVIIVLTHFVLWCFFLSTLCIRKTFLMW